MIYYCNNWIGPNWLSKPEKAPQLTVQKTMIQNNQIGLSYAAYDFNNIKKWSPNLESPDLVVFFGYKDRPLLAITVVYFN